jgi:glycosidase
MKKPLLILLLPVLFVAACAVSNQEQDTMNDPNLLKEEVSDHKIVIYQMMTRLFGNKNQTNKFYGSVEENGVGKMNDINEEALAAIKELGITHVWYTGIIEHATMTDFSAYGIRPDDADVIKGRAGSPYAIKDYYDVNPDLATKVPKRMEEFEELVRRTHRLDMKVIIDFVPNHVARAYKSDAKPLGIKDLGENDDQSLSFHPNNNFYYLPGTSFVVPQDYRLPDGVKIASKDGRFAETPAKVTGNDQFTASPGINEWFETVKLNYGVDIQNGHATHFDPIPDTWLKMKDILLFWAGKGVDGFRCDMAEMVPVEFWNWVIPQVKLIHRDLIFIAEIYNPAQYRNYLNTGRFDYLYDKVGLYDTLKAVIQYRTGAHDISQNWRHTQGINNNMLRFLENHDEQRLASPFFAGNAAQGVPAMVVSATLNSGPVMIYFGQEVGEPGAGVAGFSGDDGRTTIFDYWGVPEHQKWMNGGRFDGGGLSEEQQKLRAFYARLLQLCRQHEAIRKGGLYDLNEANADGRSQGYDKHRMYCYLRFSDKERMLVVNNFDRVNTGSFTLKIPANAWQAMNLRSTGSYQLRDMLGQYPVVKFSAKEAISDNAQEGISLNIAPLQSHIFVLEAVE